MTNKEIQMMTLLDLVSTDPDNPGAPLLSKEEQDEVYRRFKGFGNQEIVHKTGRSAHSTSSKEEIKIEYLDPDWKYIFRAVKDENFRQKLVELFEKLDEPDSTNENPGE